MSNNKNWIKNRVLGSGGFGVVTLWHHTETGQKIAVKKCRWGGSMANSEFLLTPKHIERWEKEVEIMNKLNHPGVVKCFNLPPELIDNVSELPMLCMEYCRGGDLRKILNLPENSCGLPESAVRSCLRDITEALAYLHSLRIIHRDLKPENVVVQDSDDQVRYKLIDLGYAKELEQGSVCTSFVGTLQYLAPELFLSKRYSCTVDYWSLGLLAHEIITGVRPFLPNMAPVEWMKKIKNKKSEYICAYETEKGSIEFSSTLSPETQISRPLSKELEVWLRTLLEWDPVVRGQTKDGLDGESTVFSAISNILSKKVIKIFVVETCEILDYEVTEATSMEELMRWIEKDTSLDVSNQLPLLPRGQSPDFKKSAAQCWAPSDEDEWLLYVFSSVSRGVSSPPKFPGLVEEMLRNSRQPFSYKTQRRMWAHSLLFLRREARILTLLCNSLKVIMVHLVSIHNRLTKSGQKMLSGMAKLLARHNLFMESLNSDLNMYETQSGQGVNSCKLERNWRETGEVTLSQVQALTERVRAAETSVAAVNSELLELQCSPLSRQQKMDALSSTIASGDELFSALKRKPNDLRAVESQNTEMCKLIVQALRRRDRSRRDACNFIEKECQCLSEMTSLCSPVESLLEEIARSAQFVSVQQIKRQRDIWKIMGIAIHRETKPSTLYLPRPRSLSPSVPASVPAESSLNDALSDLLRASERESANLIADNRLLRSEMMKLLSAVIPTTLNVG